MVSRNNLKNHKQNNGLNLFTNSLLSSDLVAGQLLTKIVAVNIPHVKSSSFIGVSWNKANEKWDVKIRINGRKLNVSSFIDEKVAALAYDEIARIAGRKTNFDNTSQLQIGQKVIVCERNVNKIEELIQSKYRRFRLSPVCSPLLSKSQMCNKNKRMKKDSNKRSDVILSSSESSDESESENESCAVSSSSSSSSSSQTSEENKIITTSSKFFGITRYNNRWLARITINGKKK